MTIELGKVYAAVASEDNDFYDGELIKVIGVDHVGIPGWYLCKSLDPNSKAEGCVGKGIQIMEVFELREVEYSRLVGRRFKVVKSGGHFYKIGDVATLYEHGFDGCDQYGRFIKDNGHDQILLYTEVEVVVE